MFPIPWNFPLRKKNGNLVNIGDAIDAGTEIPEHGESDAGKVLSVDESGNLEWSDEVSSEIQTLTNNLADEVSTRAKLSAHNFFTTKNPGGRGPYTRWTTEANGIRLSNSQASTYCYQQFTQNLQKNTDYTISADITVASGSAGIVIKGDNTNILTQLNISGSVKYTFNTGNYDTIMITFYCTTDTAVVGSLLYDNLLVKLATDKDETYQSYAMTNRELTEELTIKDVSGYSWDSAIDGNKDITVKRYGNIVSIYGYFNSTTALAQYGNILSGLPNCASGASKSADILHNMGMTLQNVDSATSKIIVDSATTANLQYSFSFVYLADN